MEKLLKKFKKIKIEIKELNLIRNGKFVGLEEYIYIYILTYIVVFYSFLIREYDNIFLNLCAPLIGFILSTLSLKVVRKICESRIK